MTRRTFFLTAMLVLVLLAGAQTARADGITYTFQGTASGSLGATQFANAPFTITVDAQTSQIALLPPQPCIPTPCTTFDVPATMATFLVAGFTGNITSPVGLFDNQTFTGLGLSRIVGGVIGADLLDIGSPAFATYQLNSNLGPLGPFFTSPVSLVQFNCSFGCVTTSLGGNLTFDTVQNVTFTATTTATTPEPSSLLLLGVGLGIVGAVRRKRLA